MSLRELLKATLDDVRIDKEKDNLVCINEKGEKIFLPSPVIVNGKVYTKRSVGVGEPTIKGGLFGGEGDVWEEYERYEEVLIPLFNANLVPEKDKQKIKGDIKLMQQYAKEHPETVLSLGDNPGGKKVVWLSEFEAKERLQKLQEKYDNLHIEVRHSQGNLMYGTHYVLSCRVPSEVWLRIKHCFKYTDTSEINDEVWGAAFKGYEILPDKINELENLLEIPEHLRFEKLQEEDQKRKESRKQAELEKKRFIAEIEKEFSSENAIPHGIPDGEKISLEGEEVPFRGMNSRIYGGGEWFVVQTDYIWRVINNGMDGDDWSRNNIRTGGAGAIGLKFEKTPRREEIIKRLKAEATDI